MENLASLPEGFGSPSSIGQLLFNQYLLPFEVTSILLLVAMIGAIVLTRQVKKK
jgi:NADH-quinone oxidoreductase subunit J